MKETSTKDKVILCLLVLICIAVLVPALKMEAKTAGCRMNGNTKLEAVEQDPLGAMVKQCIENVQTDPYVIEDFEVIYQLPQLQTGCEVTSLAMVLNHYGYSVDKTTLAADYLPTASYRLTYQNGKAYGPDLDAVFVGNPFGDGTICGPEAIVTTANSYLETCGNPLEAKDITGTTPAGLYLRVSNGQPVIIFVTIAMANRDDTLGWYTTDGKYVDWSLNDHGSVLIGWDEESVTVACPLTGIQNYSREQFEKIYAERGYKAAVID